jgi:hypothetical protein
MPSDKLKALQDRVQQMLVKEFTSVEVTESGFSLRHESARAFIRCVQLDSDASTIIIIEAPILFSVPASPELFKFIALHADDYHFGHLSASGSDEQSVMVMFSHSLHGDFLDEPELSEAVLAVLGIGNDLDDDMQRQFGGKRFHDDQV